MTEPTKIREVLGAILHQPDQATSVASRLCAACADLLPVSGAAISVSSEPDIRGTICASDAVMARIEDLQLTSGVGPCVDAVTHGKPVLVPMLDDRSEARWPGFADEARDAGARAVFAFPLRIGAIRLGAIDLYRDAPGGLTSSQLADALIVADAATVGVIDMQEATPVGDLDESWWDLGSFYRVEIHQATGMLMDQLDVTATEALVRLRARSYAAGMTLADLARQIVLREIDITRGLFEADS